MPSAPVQTTERQPSSAYLPHPLRVLLIPVALLLCFVMVIPLIISVPPVEGTRPVEELAGEDGQFVGIQSLRIYTETIGQGEPALLLLHGFGASTFSWREVLQPLSSDHKVIAYDRPGFGLTERPIPGDWTTVSPYSPQAQPDIAIGILDHFSVERAILVGNSAGGTVALQTALAYPQRVSGLVLVDAAVYRSGGAPGIIRPLLNTPWFNNIGPYFARAFEQQGMQLLEAAWSDPSRITAEIRDGYRIPLQAENWDVGLWEVTKAAGDQDLAGRLSEIDVPVLVITGADDQIIPPEESIRLAQDIPGARLVVLDSCGHVPQEECPQEFLENVQTFFAELER